MTENEARYFAIIPAAGCGQRMQSVVPKQYLALNQQTVIEQTLDRLKSTLLFARILIALRPDDQHWSTLPSAQDPLYITVSGGRERMCSVVNAMKRLADTATERDWVLVHDAARPCIRPQLIHELVEATRMDSVGGIVAVPIYESLKQKKRDGIPGVVTVPREAFWLAQTPQLFRYGVLMRSLEHCMDADILAQDESQAIELAGYEYQLVLGQRDNIKITSPEDLQLARLFSNTIN